MSETLSLFELSDFTRYEWSEILEQTNPKECKYYSTAFRINAQKYQSSGDSIAQEIFKFLSEITSILMEPIGLQNISFIEKMISESLSDHHLAVLRELVRAVADPEMQARMADILWICKRDSQKARPILMARIAVEAYLQSAKNLEDVGEWTNCYYRVRRAAQLAPLIDGKKSAEMRCICIVAKHIEDLIDRYAGVENEFLTGSAMKVLQEDLRKSLKIIRSDLSSYATKCATIAAQKAVFADKLQDYHKAYYQKRAYREIESEWYKILGDREAEYIARSHIAEANVWYAQQAFVGNEPNSYAVAAGRIKIAINAFRKIDDTFGQKQDRSERIQELHKQMLDYQQKSTFPMVSIPSDSTEFDDPEMQQTARELVTGRSLHEALYFLAFGYKLIQNMDKLRRKAEQDKESYKLLHSIPMVMVDTEGKTKAISGNEEDSLEDSMFRSANFYQGWFGLNFIAPACKQISSEHDVSLDDLDFLVNENPFIPQGREPLYARGLLAGLQGDTVVAIHLLIPQLENSLRYILKQHGFIASNLTSKMIQDEYTLNKVLELPDLKKVLTEDVVFTLKGLLVERMGSNSRNEVCHGLCDYGQFFTPQMMYLWWLTLYLCLIPSRNQWLTKSREK